MTKKVNYKIDSFLLKSLFFCHVSMQKIDTIQIQTMVAIQIWIDFLHANMAKKKDTSKPETSSMMSQKKRGVCQVS